MSMNDRVRDNWARKTFSRLRCEWLSDSSLESKCFGVRSIGGRRRLYVRIVGTPEKAKWEFSGGKYGSHTIPLRDTEQEAFVNHWHGYEAANLKGK